ncbi:hypothetical protein DFH27DRAFT_512665 [Peziza echinospora]|nr:hypothetical protein DFH27DRAFT_512665 [Peziza echinospora]
MHTIITIPFLLLFTLFSAGIAQTSAIPGGDDVDLDSGKGGIVDSNNYLYKRGCTRSEIRIRKAWHTLSPREKREYIDAELCLMDKPSRTPHPRARTLFDDLQGAHARQVLLVHRSGWFLPWHRYFTYAHEELLRTECGYTGAQPYWDESGEVGRFKQSKIFTPEAFGSDGDPDQLYHYDYNIPPLPGKNETNGCVTDGPFADYVLNIGPTAERSEPHCISRQLNETASPFARPEAVSKCMALDNILDFSNCIELGPHLAGHFGTGGEMDNPISSPGDPVFYLHHAWLDKLFLEWQSRDGQGGRNREREIAGYASWVPIIYGREKEPRFKNATLWDTFTVDGSVRNVQLWEALGVTKGLAKCVSYVEPAYPPP